MERVIYPRIRQLAAEEGASIFFEDEASVRTDHHAGTTWAPVGQTPVVTRTGERKAIKSGLGDLPERRAAFPGA